MVLTRPNGRTRQQHAPTLVIDRLAAALSAGELIEKDLTAGVLGSLLIEYMQTALMKTMLADRICFLHVWHATYP
jgi:hypothetical protein